MRSRLCRVPALPGEDPDHRARQVSEGSGHGEALGEALGQSILCGRVPGRSMSFSRDPLSAAMLVGERVSLGTSRQKHRKLSGISGAFAPRAKRSRAWYSRLAALFMELGFVEVATRHAPRTWRGVGQRRLCSTAKKSIAASWVWVRTGDRGF